MRIISERGLLCARGCGLAVAAAAALALAQGASAQYQTGFEPPTYTGSPIGTPVTGQDGWYLPPVANSIDGQVFTYTDNVLLLPANPAGNEQFVGGVTDGTNFVRAQHDVDFSTNDEWILGYDIAVTFSGQVPSVANLSSFSLQDSTVARFFISLNNFVNLNDPSQGWKAEYNVYNADGGPLNNQLPGPEWTGLKIDHWYRITTTVNFATNQVSQVTVTDLESGDTATAEVPWYLTGGTNPTLPLPTGIRCFVGGLVAGNTAGYDNVSADAVSDECYPDCNGDTILDFFDFLCYLNAFDEQDPYADCEVNNVFDFFDFLCYLNAFDAGC